MRRRAATAAATRNRIVQAAIDLYRRRGLEATTVAEIAERADVARATVVNHFSDRDKLADAAIERIATSLRVPTVAIFEGTGSQAERLHRLVEAMFALYERSEPWFTAFRRDLPSLPVLRRRQARFWAELDSVYDAALGPAGRGRRLRATVVALTSPSTLGALRQAGLSTKEAARVIGDMLSTFASS